MKRTLKWTGLLGAAIAALAVGAAIGAQPPESPRPQQMDGGTGRLEMEMDAGMPELPGTLRGTRNNKNVTE